MPYSTLSGAPQALRTAGLNLSQANYWAKVYDGAKASGSKFAGAIAWTQFKKKYKKAGNKWVLRKIEKDLSLLDRFIEKIEKVFQDFDVEEQADVESPSATTDKLSKALMEQLEALEAEATPLEEGEELEERYVPILKVDKKKHIVYGVVLEPEVWDAQKDIVSKEEIEDAAHEFLAFHRKIDLRHHHVSRKCYPVESYIAPQDLTLGSEKVKKGSWILGSKVTDAKIWKDIEDGLLTGYSIVGLALRVPEGATNDS